MPKDKYSHNDPNKPKRPSKEKMKKILRRAAAVQPKKKVAAKPKAEKLSWVDKLKKKVQEYFAKESRKYENVTESRVREGMRRAGATEKDIKSVGMQRRKNK